MVAVRRQPKQRHYSCGPIRQDVPLKLHDEPETQPVPWWIELSLVAAFLGLLGLLVFGAAMVM